MLYPVMKSSIFWFVKTHKLGVFRSHQLILRIYLIFRDEGLPAWPVGLRLECARVDQALTENGIDDDDDDDDDADNDDDDDDWFFTWWWGCDLVW